MTDYKITRNRKDKTADDQQSVEENGTIPDMDAKGSQKTAGKRREGSCFCGSTFFNDFC